MVVWEDVTVGGIMNWYNAFGKYIVKNYKIVSTHWPTSRVLEIYSEEPIQKNSTFTHEGFSYGIYNFENTRNNFKCLSVKMLK